MKSRFEVNYKILGGQLQQFIEHKLETYIVARQKDISILPNHMRVDLQ